MQYNLDKIADFCGPLQGESGSKNTALLLSALNIGGIIMGYEMKQPIGYLMMGIGVVLSLSSLWILCSCEHYGIRAWYGLIESMFLAVCSYLESYDKYVQAGCNLKPYLIYTQLVGWSITLLFIFLFVRTLVASYGEREITEKSIVIGYIGAALVFIIVFGGLIALYYTAFNQQMNLVQSSKMLYVAFVIQILIAYSGTKVFFITKYGKVIGNNQANKRKKGKGRKK